MNSGIKVTDSVRHRRTATLFLKLPHQQKRYVSMWLKIFILYLNENSQTLKQRIALETFHEQGYLTSRFRHFFCVL